jgi:hypothetical protein
MFHRFSTWWRALSVVLLSLATVTWPSAAHAQSTTTFSLVSQDAVAGMSARGVASFHISLSVARGATQEVRLSLYPQIEFRSEVTALINGTGTSASAVASTSVSRPTCGLGTTLALSVALFSAVGSGASPTCGNQPLHLRLPCQGAACDGVYPLKITATVNNVTRDEWSMIAVRVSSVMQPLLVDFVPVVDPTAWASEALAESNFAVIARYAALPLTLAIDYRPLSRALLSSSGHAWRSALSNALLSTNHRAIVAPPASVDLAGLATNGFSSEVANQVTLGSKFLRTITGRQTDGQVYVSGDTSDTALSALAHAGVSQVVLSDSALSEPPSNTLSWGAPFHVADSDNVTALATDGGLEQLANDAAIEPGRRAALTLATLAFLHFEEPNAPAVRTVIIPLDVGTISPTYLDDLFGASQSNPFIAPSSLGPSFNSSLIGTDASPVDRALSPSTASLWSSNNVATLRSLVAHTNSFLQAIASPTQTVALETYQALAEVTGGAGYRENALESAAGYLNAQLSGFRIDNSTITLTGSGSELPITIFSTAHYPVTVILHLITDRLSFPHNQSDYPVTLLTSTTPVRIATTDRQGGALTLQLELTTPDGQLILAKSPVEVRVAGTSVVGYILSGASLFVLAWWWWRTYRRKSRGRHAR